MRIINIGSGSKGNATLIEYQNHAIIIDCGLSIKRLSYCIDKYGLKNITIDGILITHEHGDHIRYLYQYLKKFKTYYYISKNSYDHIPYYIERQLIDNRTCFIDANGKYTLGNFVFVPIELSHDTSNIFGFIIKAGNKSIAVITDTGILYEQYFKLLRAMDVLIIESNHDVEMLLESDRDYTLKKRILSEHGHLSNDQCAEILRKIISDKTKTIMLAHLSEECNLPELAYDTASQVILDLKPSIKLLVLSQNQETIEEIDD